MEFKEGYVYHIKDDYFLKVNDNKLMQNKENGTFRPTFYCLKDNNTELLWVVPLSTRTKKYQEIYDKQVDKYGKCLTIVIGEFDDKKAAFLLQNMFPITSDYLDHVHIKNGNPVPVKHSIHQIVQNNMKQLKILVDKGKNVVFPDVKRLETLMLEELNQSKAQNTKTMQERIEAILSTLPDGNSQGRKR